MSDLNSPLGIEKIVISPKRFIYVKLWGPSHHAQWGMTRSSIELQETRISDDKQPSYGKPIRLPCDGSTALIADLISNYIIEGRQLNNQFKNQQNQKSRPSPIPKSSKPDLSPLEIEDLVLKEFKNQKLSKTRILTKLSEKGVEIDSKKLLQALESLAHQEKISKESAVHTSSGTKYYLWGFP
ncbi:MAG: hypothetical protein JSW11_04740 [Candidatus Heimdallarchaeota archaeon]|nr:MAG: hypothetical protein JSW11_04740 [Candidatus Heimdallarchaeota archaeon]